MRKKRNRWTKLSWFPYKLICLDLSFIKNLIYCAKTLPQNLISATFLKKPYLLLSQTFALAQKPNLCRPQKDSLFYDTKSTKNSRPFDVSQWIYFLQHVISPSQTIFLYTTCTNVSGPFFRFKSSLCCRRKGLNQSRFVLQVFFSFVC